MHTQLDVVGPAAASTRTFLPLRRIVCPVDFSDFSRAAVERAVALARATGAGITGLFVLPFAVPPAGDAPGRAPAAPDVGVVSALTEDLAELFRPVREAGLDLRLSVKSGDSVAQILGQAEEWEADLIVMGTHGRSGLERVVLGSVATGVLRKAGCPVLTVSRPVAGAGQTPRAAAAVGAILCALDLSEASEHSLAYALELGRSTQERVILLHVLEGPRETGARARRAADVRQRMHSAALAEEVARVPFEEMVVSGKPSREIVRVAARREVGLIVVGAGAVLGPTAGAVVRDATVPVLTVRH